MGRFVCQLGDVSKLDSRLRGNDVQKTKKWGNSCPSSYCLMKKDSGQAGMTQHHIRKNLGRTFFQLHSRRFLCFTTLSFSSEIISDAALII